MPPYQLWTLISWHAGTTQRVEVLAKEDDKYHIECADGNEDHLTYEELINLLNKGCSIQLRGLCKKSSVSKTEALVRVLYEPAEIG